MTIKTFLILGIIWIAFGVTILVSQIFSKPSIDIEWRTETEFESAGFNIYRKEIDGEKFAKINDQLIPARAEAAAGAEYVYRDADVIKGEIYYYQLQDVSLDNTTTFHDVLSYEVPAISFGLLFLSAASIIIGLVLIFVYFRGL